MTLLMWYHRLALVVTILRNLSVHAQIAIKLVTNASITYRSNEDEGPTNLLGGERSPSITIEFLKAFQWGSTDVEPDAKLQQVLTIKEAFLGTEVFVQPTKTVIRDKDCAVQKCPVCDGTTQVIKEVPDSHVIKTSIVSPCPRCRALGVVTADCQPFREIPSEPVAVSFPSGARPGHEIKLPGLGNPCFRDGDFTVGDLVVTVASVGKEQGYDVNSSGVTLTVTMTPDEALNGFIFEKEYVTDDEYLRIDRRGKVTVPGSTVRLEEMGFPILKPGASKDKNKDTNNQQAEDGSKNDNSSVEENANSDSAANKSEEVDESSMLPRDDLIIKFELEEEVNEVETTNDDEKQTSGVGLAGTLLLDSQEAIEQFLGRSEKKKKNRLNRDLLLMLRRHKEASKDI